MTIDLWGHNAGLFLAALAALWVIVEIIRSGSNGRPA
jgi:hypothetical protein